MKTDGHVLVVGAAGVDIKGMPHAVLEDKSSTPGVIRRSFGGVARNIAENLACLDVDTVFLTALGDDVLGDQIWQHCDQRGVDMQYVKRCEGGRTGSYVSILDDKGDLALAVCDYEIVDQLDTLYFADKNDLFAEAQLLVLDLNLPNTTLDLLFARAEAHKVPIVVDPTSPVRAYKLREYLSRLFLVAPNAAETKSLCDLDFPAHDLQSAVAAAHHLITRGTQIAIVTLGERGLAYADRSGQGHIPSVKTTVVDSTGAGDALTAGVIFGLVNRLSLDEAMRLGVAAASVTLRCEETVSPDMSPDLLYSSLVV